MSSADIPGYTYGTAAVAKSPVTLEELARLEQTVGLTRHRSMAQVQVLAGWLFKLLNSGSGNPYPPKDRLMNTVTSPPPEQGQLVSVRSRNWIVTAIAPSTLPPERLQTGLEAPQNLLTLSSVEDDGLGEELKVIWELEPGARVVEKVPLPDPARMSEMQDAPPSAFLAPPEVGEAGGGVPLLGLRHLRP